VKDVNIAILRYGKMGIFKYLHYNLKVHGVDFNKKNGHVETLHMHLW